MMLSSMAVLDLHEAAASAYNKVISDGYGRTNEFSYSTFNRDPRPRVLVLGHWRHPNTGNDLLGGVNLNYLTQEQTARLQQILPRILSARGLQRRYRLGKKLAPDVFTRYRTYDKEHIAAVDPGTLTFGKDAGKDAAQQASSKKVAAARTAIAKKIKQEKDAELQAKIAAAVQMRAAQQQAAQRQAAQQQAVDRQRQLDALKAARQQRRQETGQEIMPPAPDEPSLQGRPPEHLSPGVGPGSDVEGGVGFPQGELNVERGADPDEFEVPATDSNETVDDVVGKLKKRPPIPGDATEPAVESRDCYRSLRLGTVWRTPEAYRRWHTPAVFFTASPFGGLNLSESSGDLPLLAVYDLDSGVTLVDRVENHAQILHSARWEYDHTVRLMHTPTGTVALCDASPMQVESILWRVPPIVFERLEGGNHDRKRARCKIVHTDSLTNHRQLDYEDSISQGS